MTDNPRDPQMRDILKRLKKLETASPVGNTSVSEGALEIRSNEGLLVDGSAKVNGWLVVTGTERVTGRLEGSGTFDWTGPMNLRGAQNITGNATFTGQVQINGPTTIAGTLNVSGATTLNNTLTIGAGQIKAGDVTITPSGGGRVQAGNAILDGGGSYGGRVYSTGPTLLLSASGSVAIGAPYLITEHISTTGNVDVFGALDVGGAKNFRMPHPTKPDHWLRHGSTESPVSGTEYPGRVTIGADGSAVVQLPEYFEALNKPHGRTVHVTPVGRPFPVGASEVRDGAVTVYGEPGRDVFWLVKAERYGGDFILEEAIPPEPLSED